MLVLHHHALDPSERPADDDHMVAAKEVRDKSLIHNDILIPRLYDNLETLHLSFGDGEEIIGAVGVDGKFIIIRCHSGKYRAELEKCAEVVQGRTEEQESSVQWFVRNVLRGIVEIFVCVFYVANYWEIRLEVAVAEGDELIVNLLGAVVRGADWKPVFFVWHKGNPNRLPKIDVLSFGIRTDSITGCCAFGRAAMDLVQNRHLW